MIQSNMTDTNQSTVAMAVALVLLTSKVTPMTNNTNLNDFLDEIRIPDDAGEYEQGLYNILSRIPTKWGRWISCNRGWYPLIIELDQKLAEIEPEYTLHQVKEKFGTLRYYIGFNNLQPQCCIDLEAQQPIEGPINPRWLLKDQNRTVEEQYTLDKWFYEVQLPHFEAPEHMEQDEALEPERQRRKDLIDKMYKIISYYENLSSVTCEICGSKAELCLRDYLYKTLCDSCANINRYEKISDNQQD